jgi:glutamine cyclotransferase
MTLRHRPFYQTPVTPVHVLRTLPHDTSAFTQGLVVAGSNAFFESVGQYGHSELREVDMMSGRVVRSTPLASEYFGEGLTLFRGKLIQLTWRENIALVYNLESFDRGPVATFHWPREGWGLTNDGVSLIISDGSATLYFVEPMERMGTRVRRTLLVQSWEQGRLQPVRFLNALEYVEDRIYANVWKNSRIAVIHPDTGIVERWIELDGLQPPNATEEMVANGITYDRVRRRLFVTGKQWPALYEVMLPDNISRT